MSIDQLINDIPLPFGDTPAGELDPLRAEELDARVLAIITEYTHSFYRAVLRAYVDGTLTADEARYMAALWVGVFEGKAPGSTQTNL